MNPNTQPTSHKVLKNVLALIGCLLVVAAVLFVGLYRQSIIDWWELRNFVPSAQISSLADKASLNQNGRNLFYLYDPQILGKDTFNDACSVPEESIVLGCYDGQSIYMFDIQDERLVGVEEVTAAHEMLHAAYDRLSDSEKNRVDTLLQAVVYNLTDERILKLIEQYRSRDESSVSTEVHSILGTEVADLGTELEEYYAQYFIDRQEVVSLANAYEAKFLDLKKQVSDIETSLKEKNVTIEQTEVYLEQLGKEIEKERAQLDSLYAREEYAAYNARVSSFNAKVDTYNETIGSQNQRINEYNELVNQAKSLSLQLNDLLESLDSSFEPISR